MSQPGKEVPVVRPRRRINPPAHLVDYELGEPLQQRQPVPARSQSRVQSPSTAGHTKSSSPVSQDFELDKWILRDEWPSASDWRGEKVEELTAMQCRPAMSSQSASRYHLSITGDAATECHVT